MGRVSRHALEDDIKMDVNGIEWECVTRFVWLRTGIDGGVLL
jgi:hypothetical protein